MPRLRIFVTVGSRRFELHEGPPAKTASSSADAPELQAWLRRAAADPGNRAALRLFAADAGMHQPVLLEDDAVLRWLAAQLIAGLADLTELPSTLPAGFAAGAAAALQAPPQPPPPAEAEVVLQPRPSPVVASSAVVAAAAVSAAAIGGVLVANSQSEELSWITIELVGEDDKPIPNERYRIKLPNGSTREGTLNAQGLARLTGIAPGQCHVTFLDLDQDAWIPLGTTTEP